MTKADLEAVAAHINEELGRRKGNEFRKDHERIWKEVDRQIAMKAAISKVNKPDENWESNIELGSLADASEVLTADVLRILFPSDKDWFRPHIDIEMAQDINGDLVLDIERQKQQDGILKSLLTQQHVDFGLKQRVKLSLKEALHHGSFVAVVKWATQKKFHGGGRIEEIGAPVWCPHSMWNCYPDDSPSVMGTNVTYDGSMIIVEEIPLSVAVQQKWMNMDKVKEQAGVKKKNHIEIKHWYGDIFIKRSDGDMWIPNQHVIVSGEWVVFTEENETKYSPVIMSGYERDDVRDPYYNSPLIKRSPTHKLASHMANKFVEAVDLRTFPPVAYDAHEPAFRNEGGVDISPKAQFPVRAGGQVKTIEVADPTWAMNGLILFKGEVEEGTGVDSARKGTSAAREQTAFETSKIDQKSEIRTVDFVGTMENQGLKPFLYMQTDLNKKRMTTYSFFNTHLKTPDFLTATKADFNRWVPAVHFEVVGAKGVLGEERRRQGALEVTAFLAGSELFAPHLNVEEIMQDAYRDVGVKDPERYLTFNENEDPRIAQMQQQMEQFIQQAQARIQELEQQTATIPIVAAQHKSNMAQKDAVNATLQAENKLLEEQIQLMAKTEGAEKKLMALKEKITTTVAQAKNGGEKVQQNAIGEIKREFDALMKTLVDLKKQEDEERKEKDDRNTKIIQFIKANGSDAAKELANGL